MRSPGRDGWRLYGLALREAGRALGGGFRRLTRPRLRAPLPRRLLLAPQDLRTADPTVAADIYGGFFVLAGRVLETGGRSPFDFAPVSADWGAELYGFGWLRHLRAADTALAQANARALVEDYLQRRRLPRAQRAAALAPAVVARRLFSLLSHSPLLLEGAQHGFYEAFLRAIGASVAALEGGLAQGRFAPLARLQAAVALTFAGLCCEGFEGVLRRAGRVLERELDRQILPDGGHASRNPSVLLDLLLDLLPLRQIYVSRGIEPPAALIAAVDRMIPMLRLFRHPDASLSHFNGAGLTEADHLATVLMYDEARGRPIAHAPHSGYERLEAGGLLLVADVGALPPLAHSGAAHAGCLSFELSVGRERLIVNAGAAKGAAERFAAAARTTPAHSTACLGDASSCVFLDAEGARGRLARALRRRLGAVVLSGPAKVAAERDDRPGETLALTASHDGYATRFGLTHQRRWRLHRSGAAVEGEDSFALAGAASPGTVHIRFHLAPGVRTGAKDRTLVLELPSGASFAFEASVSPRVEEGIFFAATGGPQRIEQVVVAVDPALTPTVAWRLRRLAER